MKGQIEANISYCNHLACSNNVIQHIIFQYTANSRKVVLGKSKIQITKYKIQEKISHITRMRGLLTSSV